MNNALQDDPAITRAAAELKLRREKTHFGIARFFAIATAATSLLILSRMDNGDDFDLHAKVASKPEYHDLATDYENRIRLACAFFTVMGGVNCEYRRRKLKKAQETVDNLPRGPRP
ncbi:MAG: hypothetical protein HYS17_05780 [Micavibrio aeruginosavorus]|uniref:Uncharacterized protein n=1 Tax=Micavibrio aeruginosavorus TaxID=349221 RepID=A0A7T5UIB0_9BACT|nr:MAG: hypothetical protein HYS17_05780 [Micavibrio aeruginosavorus]